MSLASHQKADLHGVALSCWPPQGDAEAVDRRHRHADGFVQSCAELAAAAAARGTRALVVVTHREGIWELQAAARRAGGGARGEGCYRAPPLKYCSVEGFWIDTMTGAVSPASPGAKPGPTAHELAVRARASFAGLLAAGTGRVVFRRRLDRPGEPARLLLTPGVDGVWVEGATLADGDVVELLTPPSEAEGKAERFVKVACGQHEGWTLVANVGPVPALGY